MRDGALTRSVRLDANELALVLGRIIRDNTAADDSERTTVLTLSCLLLLLTQLLLRHGCRVGLERTHGRALVHLLLLLLVSICTAGRLLHWLINAVVAHTRPKLASLLLTIRSFAFSIGLLLVDDLYRLIIVIILYLLEITRDLKYLPSS